MPAPLSELIFAYLRALSRACAGLVSLGLVLTVTCGAQEPPGGILTDLRSGEVSRIAAAIVDLSPDSLHNKLVVRDLVLLLDDGRLVHSHGMPSRTVRGLARYKLWDLEKGSASAISSHLSSLTTDFGVGLALEAIARIGRPNAVTYEQVSEYCSHSDPFVRSRAITALSAVAKDDTEIVVQLGEFLSDSDPMVRWTVLDCLGERPTAIGSLVPAIGQLLEDDSDVYIAISDHASTPSKLRGRAARLLGSIDPPAAEALPKLRELLDVQNDLNVRVWAAAAICAISDQPPPEVIELLGELLVSDMDDEWASNDAVEAITELGPRALPLIERLEQAKNHRSGGVRWGLTEAFFAVHPESAVGRVLPLVEDDDELIADAAIQALSARGVKDQGVINAYIKALGRRDGVFDEPASSAIRALAKLGAEAESALPALNRLASDTEAWDTLRDDARRAVAVISESGGEGPDR